MGLGPFSSDKHDSPTTPSVNVVVDHRYPQSTSVLPPRRTRPQPRPLPNPNPRNFVIAREKQVGSFLVLLVVYPDCTNFEGKKIMVYENCTISQLRAHVRAKGILDPHFSDSDSVLSPIARFIPTEDGFELAIQFCSMIENARQD